MSTLSFSSYISFRQTDVDDSDSILSFFLSAPTYEM